MADIEGALKQLRGEREAIEEAILSLERLARSRGKKVGRPPAWMTDGAKRKRRGRPPGSKKSKPGPQEAPEWSV